MKPPKAIATGIATAIAIATLALQQVPASAADAPGAAAEPRWDLRDLYATAADWDTAVAAVQKRVQTLDALRDGATKDAASLRHALEVISDTQRDVLRLYAYAHLAADEDLRNARGQERRQQVSALFGLLSEKTAWTRPDILAAGDDRVRGFIAADSVLKARFDHDLDDILRSRPHTLNAEGEALLAGFGPALAQASQVQSQLVDSELPRSTVTLADGKSIELTVPGYELARQSRVREDRKKAFDGFFGSLKKLEGTLGANLTGNVLADVYSARAHHFGSSLEAALFADAMPAAVYKQLVAQANAGLPALHRYLRLRKRLLGIDGELAYYDNYPPVAAPPAQSFSYENSKAITLTALAPLGDEYLSLLKKGFAQSWVDVHPRPTKASGGYMFGAAYDVHPYLLLNHNDDYQSLSTLAHEWGHAVHTMLTTISQPYEKSNYSTFIAESASIGNEMLLADSMIASAKTAADKRYYLLQALESIRTTFFRQTMFAEFELAMHEEAEAGRPLAGPRLSELYCGIAKRYYGEAQGVMTVDPAYCVEWAYVSHFFRNFYVWQYATSMVGAAEFAQAIQTEGAPARDRFVNMLKAGGSDYPYPIYLRAGVDLAKPGPYQALIARMNRLMDQVEALGAAEPKR